MCNICECAVKILKSSIYPFSMIKNRFYSSYQTDPIHPEYHDARRRRIYTYTLVKEHNVSIYMYICSFYNGKAVRKFKK